MILDVLQAVPPWAALLLSAAGVGLGVAWLRWSTRSGPQRALHGSLAVLSLPSLLSLLEHEHATGVVGIWGNGAKGHLVLRDGELVDALCQVERAERGRPAVYSLLGAGEAGNFSFAPGPVPDGPGLGRVTGYLMEKARRDDEATVR